MFAICSNVFQMVRYANKTSMSMRLESRRSLILWKDQKERAFKPHYMYESHRQRAAYVDPVNNAHARNKSERMLGKVEEGCGRRFAIGVTYGGEGFSQASGDAYQREVSGVGGDWLKSWAIRVVPAQNFGAEQIAWLTCIFLLTRLLPRYYVSEGCF